MRKHHAVSKFFLHSAILQFDKKWEVGALCEKEEVCVPPFFSVLLRIRASGLPD